MSDTDNNTTNSLCWSPMFRFENGATGCSVGLGNNSRLDFIKHANDIKSCYYNYKQLNPELPQEAVAEAASLHSRLCPLISELRERLHPKPEFSGQASKDNTNLIAAWTEAKDFLTEAESRADEFSRIYLPHDNGEFMPKEEAEKQDQRWRSMETESVDTVDNQDPIENNQTPACTITGSVPATVI